MRFHGLVSPQRRAIATLILGAMATGCRPAPDPQPANPPPWPLVELNGRPLPGEIWVRPDQLPAALFSPLPAALRVLVYPFPQIREIQVPPDARVRDVAFLDIGGRVIAAYPQVTCPGPGPCKPLASPFPATGVLVARAGVFRQTGLAAHKPVRWTPGPGSLAPPGD